MSTSGFNEQVVMPKKRNPQFNVRIPPELKEQVTALAEKNKRSVNAEIVAALELVCRKAFGKVVEKEDGVEITLNEADSMVLNSHMETLKKIIDADRKMDILLAEVKKLNAKR